MIYFLQSELYTQTEPDIDCGLSQITFYSDEFLRTATKASWYDHSQSSFYTL